MAHHDSAEGHGHGVDEEAHVHHSHTKQYVVIFFILLVVTAIEVAIPVANRHLELGIPKIPEVLALISLMFVKGTMVVMYYMHLKGDRRMYSSLFVFPMIIVGAMILGFMFLFQPILW